MKNSNLLQALIAGGIAIGIALGGAGLGVALDKKNKQTTSVKAPASTSSSTTSNDWVRLSAIASLGTFTNYYNKSLTTSLPNSNTPAGKLFDDHLKKFNDKFKERKFVLATGTNIEMIKNSSLLDDKTAFMDELFLILVSNLPIKIKQSFVSHAMSLDEKTAVLEAIMVSGTRLHFYSAFNVVIVGHGSATNGFDGREKKVVYFWIVRNWAKTDKDDDKYKIFARPGESQVMINSGFTGVNGVRAKLGLASDEELLNWEIIALKSSSGKAKNDGSDSSIMMGVNKKTGQVAYYIAPGTFAGATGKSYLGIGDIKIFKRIENKENKINFV